MSESDIILVTLTIFAFITGFSSGYINGMRTMLNRFKRELKYHDSKN